MRMRLIDAKEFAAAVVPHASKDFVTPVLTTVALGGHHGQYAYTSDRYTVARYDLEGVAEDIPEEEVRIPASALAIVRTLGPATLLYPDKLDQYWVEITTEKVGTLSKTLRLTMKLIWDPEDDAEPVVNWMRVWDTYGQYGNFPPLYSLFAKFKRGGDNRTMLGADQVNKIIGYAKMIHSPMRVTMADESEEKRAVPSPVLFEAGRRLKVLVQPVKGSGFEFGSELEVAE